MRVRLALFAALALSVAAAVISAAPARVLPPAATSVECLMTPDTCCEAAPKFRDPAYASFLGHPIAVVTFWNDSTGSLGTPYVLRVLDLQNPPTDCPAPSNPNTNNWNDPKYSAPGWTTDSLGLVFGLTLDKFGNIYVTHTSCFSYFPSDNVGPGGPGAIYRIDAVTGYVSVFAVLPNAQDPAVISSNGAQESFPGLGNISYDCDHNQFFVTDMEDGKIYRLRSTNSNNASPAAVLSSFDHGAPDTGAPGWAPLGERLWAVQWHNNRVYYGVWNQDLSSPSGPPNQIWSVALGAGGAFVAGSDQLEINLPPYQSTWSNPPSDISFGPDGRMLIAERSMYGPTQSNAHQSRTLEYICQQNPGAYTWAPSGNTFDIGILAPSGPSSAGGVDYDRRPCLVWSTGDYLSNLGYLYGLQGNATTGGNPTTALLIDYNGSADYNKTQVGDVEVPCADTTHGEIHGNKFRDLNHDGINSSEPSIPGYTIRLTDPSNAVVTTTTDAAGNYGFTGLGPGNYVVDEVQRPNWVQFAPNAPPFGKYNVALATNQIVLNKNFANDSCGPDSCTHPPSGMVAWWPFNEATTSITVKDIVHLPSGINTGVLSGFISVFNPGKVGNCLHAVTGYVKVANHATLNFNSGTGDFSIDCWVNVASAGGSPRVIVDKRQPGTPYKGYIFYLNGMVPTFEMSNGSGAPAVVTGPAIPGNTWVHLAVTCHRAVGGLKMYENGTLMTALNPIAGSIASTQPLYMGNLNPAFGNGAPFEGYIDELELFAKELTGVEVRNLFAAQSNGKCKEFCYVPSVTSFWAGATTATTAVTICNYDPFPMTFNWSLAGLPAGLGCDVAGPTTFSPPAGTVTLAPGACVNIPITITRPAGLATTKTACYQLTITNNRGRCYDCFGKVRGDSCVWYAGGNPGVTAVPPSGGGSLGAPISYIVYNPCATPISLNYTLDPRPREGDGSATDIKLNGLPPGEPVIGTLDVAANDSGLVTVNVDLPSYAPFNSYEIVLEADTDGDGVAEDVASEGVMNQDEAIHDLGSAGPDPLVTSLKLAAAPNPFRGSTDVRLVLATAQAVRIGVYDVNGRLVRALHEGRLGVGSFNFTWDGSDAQGREVGGGIYFIRATLADRSLNAKVVRLN